MTFNYNNRVQVKMVSDDQEEKIFMDAPDKEETPVVNNTHASLDNFRSGVSDLKGEGATGGQVSFKLLSQMSELILLREADCKTFHLLILI